MKKLRKVLAIAMSLMMVLAIATGCSSSNSGDSEEKVVTVAIGQENGISTMDATYAMTDITHYELIYEPLVVYGENGKLEPGLAESWDISEDGLEYTFHLREGVKFSDGTDFNADNVIFYTNRWKDNSNTASTTVATAIQKVEKIDEYTVKITFDKQYYPYLTELSYPRPCRMMAQSALDENGKFKEPIGTGMWKVESFEEGKETVLVPNEHYWGEKPKIDKLIIKVIPDAEARMMALQNGEIDMDLNALSAENQEIVAKEDSLDIFSRDGVLGIHLLFNYDNEILGEDKSVRQAINYAIDNNTIVETILKGNGIAAKGLIQNTAPYVTEENSLGYDCDMDKAKELLKEAGYTDSDNDGIVEKDGKPLNFKFVLQTDEYPDWKAVSEYIQSQLKQVGIGVELNVQDCTSYYDAIWTSRDYDISIYRTYADSWAPHGFLLGMYCKASEDSVRVAWDSDELDEMIQETLQTVDEAERQEDYDEIFEYLYEEAVNAPLYYTKDKYAYNKDRITGIENAPTAYELIKWNKIDIIK